MKVCVLYSGGKDSNLALLKAHEVFDVACLVTLSPKSEESSIFHYPNVELVRLQAEALRIPLIMKACPDDEAGSLKALYEVLRRAKKEYGVEGVVTGAIRSTYQATRFQRVCDDLELWCFNPLWLRDELSILEEALERKFEIIFVRVAGLDRSLLGKRLDRSILKRLAKMRGYVNPAGEGGEYETFVLNMPLFRRRIEILDFEIVGNEFDATLVVREAKLV